MPIFLYSDLGSRTLQQRPNVKVSSLFTPGEQSFEAGPKRSIHYQADYDELPSFIWYPLNIVERVDLIEGGNTVLWGDVGDSRGIISVTTKRGEDLDNAVQTLSARDVGFASPLGYQTPAEFYAPAYATEKARPLDGPRLPHDALLESDRQARRYGTGHRRVLHLRRTGRLRHYDRGHHADGENRSYSEDHYGVNGIPLAGG